MKINHLNAGLIENDNELWLLGRYGLIKYNIRTGKYKLYEKDFSKDKQGLLRFVSLNFSPDKRYLWFAERSGILYRFDIISKKYEVVKTNLKNKGTKLIIDIEVDEKGRIWVATFGSGVLIYDHRTKDVITDLTIEELESYVYGIVNDDEGNMWISSNFGVSKVNIEDLTFITYKEDAGSLSGEYNKRTYYKKGDGIILFGGENGFIEINTQKIYKNKECEAPLVSAWSKNLQKTNYLNQVYEDVKYLNDTILTYKHGSFRDIQFFISVPSYSHGDKNRILWKLEGDHDNWIENYSYEPILFNNLKPGDYILRVRAFNNHGIESKEEARMHIFVIPQYYQTVWFKVLIAFVILILMYSIFRVRITWYKDQKKVLVATVVEKTKAITQANIELEASREEVLKQNAELHIHRNNLEELVQIRTQDLERAMLEVKESDRLKTAFLANLSHEIRTPMNAIIGFSSLIQIDDFPEDQKKEFIKLIGQSSESLLALIDDIIDISRIETGNVKMVYQDIHLPSLVQETFSELSFEERSDKIEEKVIYELAKEVEVIYVDKQRLKQILSNLLRNAFKFTKEGYVKLRLKSTCIKELKELGFVDKKGWEEGFLPVLFCIEDTGIGIQQEDLEIIFQPFQKANENQELYKGMGLGLSIVKSLIILFGGDIIVKSEVNKGTQFYFYIDAHSIHQS